MNDGTEGNRYNRELYMVAHPRCSMEGCQERSLYQVVHNEEGARRKPAFWLCEYHARELAAREGYKL